MLRRPVCLHCLQAGGPDLDAFLRRSFALALSHRQFNNSLTQLALSLNSLHYPLPDVSPTPESSAPGTVRSFNRHYQHRGGPEVRRGDRMQRNGMTGVVVVFFPFLFHSQRNYRAQCRGPICPTSARCCSSDHARGEEGTFEGVSQREKGRERKEHRQSVQSLSSILLDVVVHRANSGPIERDVLVLASSPRINRRGKSGEFLSYKADDERRARSFLARPCEHVQDW